MKNFLYVCLIAALALPILLTERAASQPAPAGQKTQIHLAKPLAYDSGGSSNSVAVADLNGDGIPDLIVANYCQNEENDYCISPSGGVVVMLGDGDGTFHAAVAYGTGGV